MKCAIIVKGTTMKINSLSGSEFDTKRIKAWMLVVINSTFTFKRYTRWNASERDVKSTTCAVIGWVIVSKRLTRHWFRASADHRWSSKWASTSTGCPNTFYLMLRNHLDGRDTPNHPEKRQQPSVNICTGNYSSVPSWMRFMLPTMR